MIVHSLKKKKKRSGLRRKSQDLTFYLENCFLLAVLSLLLFNKDMMNHLNSTYHTIEFDNNQTFSNKIIVKLVLIYEDC